jgi:hypothetical protein
VVQALGTIRFRFLQKVKKKFHACVPLKLLKLNNSAKRILDGLKVQFFAKKSLNFPTESKPLLIVLMLFWRCAGRIWSEGDNNSDGQHRPKKEPEQSGGGVQKGGGRDRSWVQQFKRMRRKHGLGGSAAGPLPLLQTYMCLI